MNLVLGVFFHWVGGLAAASFYIPYRAVQRWSWETYWLVGGLFSWILAPSLLGSIFVPDLYRHIAAAPRSSVLWCYFFGVLWGIGGITFGLTMRYLGIALGMAVALGFCAAFGTLMPPIFAGDFGRLLTTVSGLVVLAGVGACLLGIGLNGAAGMSKEGELSAEEKAAAVKAVAVKVATAKAKEATAKATQAAKAAASAKARETAAKAEAAKAKKAVANAEGAKAKEAAVKVAAAKAAAAKVASAKARQAVAKAAVAKAAAAKAAAAASRTRAR